MRPKLYLAEFFCLLLVVKATRSPLIGMFSLPFSDETGQPSSFCPKDQPDCEFLPASYVRYIESAGAEVVPVSLRASIEEIDHLMNSLNGFLFTGGGDIEPPPAVHRLLARSKAMFEAGEASKVLPVWGTCLGFEWLVNVSAPGCLETGFSACNMSLPLNLQAAASSSRLLGKASESIREALTRKNTTFNSHHNGVTPVRWKQYPALDQTFQVLATSVDVSGEEFVSVVEGAHGLPWFGVQWHPEKNIFEHGRTQNGLPFQAIDHSSEGIAVAQYMANFFVEQARLNSNTFESEADQAARLIYGRPITQKFAPAFQEVYVLNYPKTKTQQAGLVADVMI